MIRRTELKKKAAELKQQAMELEREANLFQPIKIGKLAHDLYSFNIYDLCDELTSAMEDFTNTIENKRFNPYHSLDNVILTDTEFEKILAVAISTLKNSTVLIKKDTKFECLVGEDGQEEWYNIEDESGDQDIFDVEWAEANLVDIKKAKPIKSRKK